MKKELLVLLALILGAGTALPSAAETDATDKKIADIGVEAYIYGYPLVTMEITRRVMTNVSKPEGAHAPMGQFLLMRKYPDASFKDVTAPNADTLYFTLLSRLMKDTPPAEAFWSLTMYDGDYFFVDDPLGQYTVSPRNDLPYNVDGSLDLFIQHESPGNDKEANWLPAPKGKFVLMMRLYWPQEKSPSILDGTWSPPAVKQQTAR